MDTTVTTVNRTVVRHPAHLIITGYSIIASDPYGDENRETVEIIGDADQITNGLVDWIALRHRDAQGGSKFAAQDLERIAGAMGLTYPTTTGEA
ncbi:MAG: hypothetical protein VXB01_07040 [Opitutae bacterium]